VWKTVGSKSIQFRHGGTDSSGPSFKKQPALWTSIRMVHVEVSKNFMSFGSWSVELGNIHKLSAGHCSEHLWTLQHLATTGTPRPQGVSFISRNLAVISESRLDEFMRAELSIFEARQMLLPDTFRDPVLQALMIFDVQAKSLKNYLYLLQVLRWVAV